MLADREAGNTEKVIEEQFQGSVGALTPEEFSRILIAYEPVWAIGTGRTATPEIAAAVHKFVRQCAAATVFPKPCFRLADSLWRKRQA